MLSMAKSTLLDTHVWLWLATNPDRIPRDVLDSLEDLDTEVYLSAASVWEIAIKYRTKRLSLRSSPRTYVANRLLAEEIQMLPVQLHHAIEVAELPDHHTDPFDRMLVAQARVESLRLISADRLLEPYDVDLLLI